MTDFLFVRLFFFWLLFSIIDRLHDNVNVGIDNIFNLDVELSVLLLGFNFFFSLFIINLIIVDYLLDLFLITFFRVDDFRLTLCGNLKGTHLMHLLKLFNIILIGLLFFLTLFFNLFLGIFHIDVVIVLDLFVFV